MTFANIPLAVDGALTGASLLRKGLMASLKGGGVARANDLRVTATVPNAQSLQISSGLAIIPNGYQGSSPDEVYVEANPNPHTITSSDMPSSSGSTTYWMVCLVVGDPAYDQTGHPFMPSDFSGEDPNAFQYVRPVLLACSSLDTRFEDLGKPYPGLALARLQIPPSTTTITDAMITDLRVIAGGVRHWEAVPSADVLLGSGDGTAGRDIPGLSITVPAAGPLDYFRVQINGDVTSPPGYITVVELEVDGVTQARQLICGGVSGFVSASRGTYGQTWTINNLSAGNHTFTAHIRTVGGGGASSISAAHSVMSIDKIS